MWGGWLPRTTCIQQCSTEEREWILKSARPHINSSSTYQCDLHQFLKLSEAQFSHQETMGNNINFHKVVININCSYLCLGMAKRFHFIGNSGILLGAFWNTVLEKTAQLLLSSDSSVSYISHGEWVAVDKPGICHPCVQLIVFFGKKLFLEKPYPTLLVMREVFIFQILGEISSMTEEAEYYKKANFFPTDHPTQNPLKLAA